MNQVRGNTGLKASGPETGAKAARNGTDAESAKRFGKGLIRQLTSGAGRKDKPLRTTDLAGLEKESNRVRRERHRMRMPILRPLNRDSPDAPLEVELFPPSTTHLEGTRGGKDEKFERQPGEDPAIRSMDCGDD